MSHWALGMRIAQALDAACHPRGLAGSSVPPMGRLALALMTEAVPLPVAAVEALPPAAGAAVADLVAELFEREGRSLVRLARLFVDDRNAAEDLVQEAFIRLARSTHRIRDGSKAPAYLRSIVLNLARDHNRRGLVSLRHHPPADGDRASTEDEIELREDHRKVLEALRGLPHRQRDCVVLRYYDELGIDGIAEVLRISRNSVKTHLTRGMASLEQRLGDLP
ncbi:MAG: RNA polymerase sigma factor [Acidimicrobiales bacterium]